MAITTTARTLIGASLKLIGVLAEGETASGPMQKDAFARLNELVDGWSAQRLTQRVFAREPLTLVPTQKRYTIGPLADLATARPTIIDYATLVVDGHERRLHKLTDREFATIPQKDQPGQPTAWYHEPAMPAAVVQVWPVPTAAGTVALYLPVALTQFATPATAYTLAPAYMRALRTNLALELAPEYGRQVEPWLVQQATDSLADLKRLNLRPEVLELPRALVGRAGRGAPRNNFDLD